ncbi:MAG: hypothetical protein JXK05_08375 [Campylobacterales bacterium]|nr:hypothetical protein [Campylobacterales bacterium]
MRRLFILLILSSALQAATLQSAYALKASGLVTDLLHVEQTLYAATDRGIIDLFDIATQTHKGTITLPAVPDFLGDLSQPKIYSIDAFEGALLIVSQGKSGYRDVYMYRERALERLIDERSELIIKKGLFVDAQRIVLGLLSSEIVLFDLKTRTPLYRKAIKARRSGGSALGDIVLSEERKTLITADESGEVNLFKVDDFTHQKLFIGQNLDNIYKIDYKNGTVITAGQDRRCAIYRQNGEAYYVNGSFLIYAAALSPSAALGVFASSIENDLLLFDTQTKANIATLKGHDATLVDILFMGEEMLISAAEEKRILFWNLKQ